MIEGTSGYRADVLSLVADWLVWLEQHRGRSHATVMMYRRILSDWCERFGDRALDRMSVDEIERWVARPRWGTRSRGQVPSPATQHRDRSAVRSFYRYLIARGIVATDPTALVVTPKIQNVNPKPIDGQTWLRLWDAAADSPFQMDRVTLFLQYGAGLRRAEVTVLRCGQVSGDLVIRDFVRKGGGEDSLDVGALTELFDRELPKLRLIEGADLLADTVLRRDRDEWLVGWADVGRPRQYDRRGLADGQLHPQHLNAWLHRLCRRAGVELCSPHQLRHSFATNLIRADVPLPLASRLMNHANVTTTMRYVRAGSSELREYMRRTGDRVTPDR